MFQLEQMFLPRTNCKKKNASHETRVQDTPSRLPRQSLRADSQLHSRIDIVCVGESVPLRELPDAHVKLPRDTGKRITILHVIEADVRRWLWLWLIAVGIIWTRLRRRLIAVGIIWARRWRRWLRRLAALIPIWTRLGWIRCWLWRRDRIRWVWTFPAIRLSLERPRDTCSCAERAVIVLDLERIVPRCGNVEIALMPGGTLIVPGIHRDLAVHPNIHPVVVEGIDRISACLREIHSPIPADHIALSLDNSGHRRCMLGPEFENLGIVSDIYGSVLWTVRAALVYMIVKECREIPCLSRRALWRTGGKAADRTLLNPPAIGRGVDAWSNRHYHDECEKKCTKPNCIFTRHFQPPKTLAGVKHPLRESTLFQALGSVDKIVRRLGSRQFAVQNANGKKCASPIVNRTQYNRKRTGVIDEMPMRKQIVTLGASYYAIRKASRLRVFYPDPLCGFLAPHPIRMYRELYPEGA